MKYFRTHKALLLVLILIVGLVLISILLMPTVAQSATNPGIIVVQTIPDQTLTQQIIGRIQTSWPWYLVRGSGLIAALSLVILILSGLGSVTGQTFKFLEPLTAWASHRALGIVFGISVLIHMAGLLFDHFVSFDLMTLLVPWLSNYKPVTVFGLQLGSLYVALGVLAFYGAAIIVITSLLWVEKKPYIWKSLHLLSYLVLVFVFIHALYLGTDLVSGFLRWLWIAIGVGGMGLIVYRLWRSRTTL